VLRLLDAHAGFGLLRQALATSRGVDATAVQVTPAQESMVYARAHAVLAGSAAAAAALDERHFGRTIHLPYWDDSGAIAPPAAERRFSRIRPLRLAFPEPEGPGQAAERHAFLQVLARCIILYDPPVAPVGVEEPGGSAGPPDILILLEEPSPGQDIAMAEAMRHGLPVLARQGASRRTLAEAIVRLAFAEDSVQDLRLAAACWAAKRGAEHAAGTQALALWLREGSRRILVIADRPFWLRDHFMAESLAQALEFVSRIGRVVLCCVTERPPPADAALPPLDCLHEPDAGALAAALQRLTERVTFTGAVFLSTEYAVTIPLADVLVAWSLPVWHLGLEADGVNTGLVFRPQAEGLGLPVSCLKYVPPKAVRPAQPLPHLLVLAPQAASRWQDIVLRYSDVCTPAAEPWSLAGAIRAFLLRGRVASRAEAAGWDDVYVALRDFR
jgi:hypothetical protein